MEVVELRKNMERVLEVEAMQAQHFPTVHHLLELSNKQEQSIAQMAVHIKDIESRNMEAYLEALQKDRLERTTGGNEIIERGHQLVLELKDFKRTFSINTGAFSQS
jgi:predicted house-cleaning NTP pyrophosphatase (Maf/HAM1 superfamily)